ncbi:hypothetical protein [Paenibacillus sp. DMB20]|uniref:hypothetical protein n=1 Tax=Paenibacillus sp. DMB20 TaxID=1642570 RepID=UPI000B13B16A|nr:hypothetical protein [Paenibacillus sp. DMB20]
MMCAYSPVYWHYGFRQASHWALTPSAVELNRKFRTLLEQHVYWTRLTVNSIVGDLPDVKETTERLLRNPDDFAAVLALYYGSDIAARFANLFRSHLTIAAELVGALKSGNAQAAADAQMRWYANADAICSFSWQDQSLLVPGGMAAHAA